MGNNCCVVEGAVDHWVYVKAGDRKTTADCKLRVILFDVNDNQSPEIRLDIYYDNQFQRGLTKTFQAPPLGQDFSDVSRIELWRESEVEPCPDWYIETVMVNDRRKEKYFYFPIHRWLMPNQRYKITVNDTSLPLKDPNRGQREAELADKRAVYQYGQAAPDLPVQARSLPDDEQFSDSYKWDLATMKDQYIDKSGKREVMQSNAPWEELPELTSFFNDWYPSPPSVKRWTNDICFGVQRILGCNPNMIKLCTELPENMGVTAEMLRPYLEGWTLKQIVEAKRLYSVDFKILEDIPTKDDAPLAAPVGLFFVTGDKALVPIAIQLYQDIAPDNPVFLPNDDPFAWLLAKMWFNLADSQVHQALTHIGFLHMVVEGANIAMHRHLSQSHPVFKLLAPHFLFIMAVNAQAVEFMISPDGWVDRNMTIGREGLLELIRRGMDDWRLDVQGNFPKELESRGVLDPKTLPNYAYRDDGLLLHKAIDSYVAKILRVYYKNLDDLRNDYELQNWMAELALDKEDGGVGLQGIPNNGKIRKLEEVGLVCTSLIFSSTVQHAAISYPMYDEYGFPPNYPANLYGEPPDKLPKTEDDIVQVLPTQGSSIEVMTVTKLLSTKATQSLTNWDFQFQFDPPALAVEKEFRAELRNIADIIDERNERREDLYRYTYLHPDVLPNFISL